MIRTEVERLQLYNEKDMNKGELVLMDRGEWEWESLEGVHRYKPTELCEIVKRIKEVKAIVGSIGDHTLGDLVT